MSAMPHQPWPLPVTGARLQYFLFWILGILACLSLVGEVRWHYHPTGFSENFVQLFSLSYESNIPTWYAASLLFWCGLLLARISLAAGRWKEAYWWHWRLLAVIFFYLSLDEAVGIHENFGGLVDAKGIFYFDWIVPVGLAVVLLGLFFFPFLRNLPKETRRRFVLAGALYVGGALMMEMPLGYWTSQYGTDNLGYAFIDFVEEVLELAGASVFLAALWNYADREPFGKGFAK